MSGVRPVPEGFHTVTPCLVVNQAREAIEFYRNAFGGEELYRHTCQRSGLITNAKLRIGDSMLLLSDEFPINRCRAPSEHAAPSVTIHLYVENVDEFFEQAIAAGATITVPLTNAFWGDRFGQLQDPFGHLWTVATHLEDIAPEVIDRRARDVFANQTTGAGFKRGLTLSGEPTSSEGNESLRKGQTPFETGSTQTGVTP